MDEVLANLLLLILVFGWREITSGPFAFGKVQTFLHSLPPLVTPFVQWYGLLFVGLGLLLLRTFWDVVRFEYWAYSFLKRSDIEGDPEFLPELTEEQREDLHMENWLRWFSLAAPVAGLAAGVLVMVHVASVAFAVAQRRKAAQHTKGGLALPWRTSKEMNCVLLVVAMPIVFILMSMRAEIRVWAVMTGSAWRPFRKMVLAGEVPPRTWDEVALLEIGTYQTDLELAGFFQFITIWNLGKLCIIYLKKAPRQYRTTLRLAGLQGVYLYVTFGCIRSFGLFAQAIVSQNPEHTLEATTIQTKVLAFVGPIFTVATLLCVINMIIICKMEDVRDRLGSANMKFQATRALLLISQIQPQVIGFLIVSGGVPSAPALAGHLDSIPGWVLHILTSLNLSEYRGKLLHAALLNFECLAVVVWNFLMWRADFDYEREDALCDGRSARAVLAAAKVANFPPELLAKLETEAKPRTEGGSRVKATEAALAAARVAGISKGLIIEMEKAVAELEEVEHRREPLLSELLLEKAKNHR